MNKRFYVPDGEKGSINYLTKIVIDNPFDVAMMYLPGDAEVLLNVINNLNHYGGPEIALEFSKNLIKLKSGLIK